MAAQTQVARMTLYINRIPIRKENDSFTVEVKVWEGNARMA